MLILLSPAKTLDLTPTERDLPATKPALHTEAKKLAKAAKELSEGEVAELMELSDKLAATAHGYLQDWKAKWDPVGAKQAILAFRGDVYQGFDADTLTDKQLERAQKHVRILSGLYGVLRPLDLMQAYRLEMGRKLGTERGDSLYAWWGDRVTDTLNAEVGDATPRGLRPLVVNLASNEYAGVVDFDRLEADVVTPQFKERKGGKLRIVSFFAKRARGAMARHLVTCRQKDLQNGRAAIEAFDADGYKLDSGASSDRQPVFARDSAS